MSSTIAYVESIKNQLSKTISGDSNEFKLFDLLLSVATEESRESFITQAIGRNLIVDINNKHKKVFEVKSHKQAKSTYTVSAKSKKEAAILIGCSYNHMVKFGYQIGIEDCEFTHLIMAANNPEIVFLTTPDGKTTQKS
jgi:hypothetical protein